MQKTLLGTDPETREEIWAEVTRVCDSRRRLGYRLTCRGQRINQVLDVEGRWIDERDATAENSVWRSLRDAEASATLSLHR